MNVIYIKEMQETRDFVKKIILNVKYFFNIIDIKNEEGKIMCYLPIPKNKNISKRKTIKLLKKVTKELEKNGVNDVVLSEHLNTLEELKNRLYSENINILDGRYLFKCLIQETISYILKIQNEDIQKAEISILVNDFNEINKNLVVDISKEVRGLNVITNHIAKWSKIEDSLYNEFGILLNVSNNREGSLKSSKIIMNIDFPSELINQYKIYDTAIIVNILGKVQIKSKKFNGININYFEIKMPKKYKLEGFKNEVVYESLIHKKGLYKARSIILNDKIRIKKLIGNNGYLKESEFRTKHLTKVK